MKLRLPARSWLATSVFAAYATLFPLTQAFAEDPAAAQAPASAAATNAAPAPAAAATGARARGVLWEVRSGKKTAYLFGSIHLAKAEYYPLPDTVENAFKQADTLAVEIDASDSSAVKKMMPLLAYQQGDNLQKHLKPATWKKLQKLTGPAADRMQAIKPAVVASALVVSAFAQKGFDPKQGVDLHFIERARKDSKAIVELESPEFQAKILGGLSDADGDAMLAETLDGMFNGNLFAETNKMISAWKDGDAVGLGKILNELNNKDAGSRHVTKLLLDDRNPGMADKIAAMIKDGKHLMVVVGALHMTGKHSLVELLQKKGFEVRLIDAPADKPADTPSAQ